MQGVFKVIKNNIANILISVIGKGRLKKDQTVGYEQTEYVFNPDTNKKLCFT
jgi:cell division protein DivIC